MQSKAASVAEYLDSLPEDRRAAIQAVREVFRRNLDKTYTEGMTYGMIGYFVPHSVYPNGYHCDPRQPLPFAGLASQKQHMSLYLMGTYVGADETSDTDLTAWFKKAWAATGKKLDMGKACIRFKRVDDLALDVIGEALRRLPAKTYIAMYEKALATQRADKSGGKKATPTPKNAKPAKPKKPAPKKPAPKNAATKKPARKN